MAYKNCAIFGHAVGLYVDLYTGS